MFADLFLSQFVLRCDIQLESKASDGGLLVYAWALDILELGTQSCSLLCRCMALALAPHNVRVNAIGPGSIMTDVLAAVANDKAAMNK
jgi:hypothetical protein